MTQIRIQLDASTIKKLESTAAKNRKSVTEWIKDRIYLGLKQDWPEDYFALFGSLDEDDLSEPPDIPFAYESSREEL